MSFAIHTICDAGVAKAETRRHPPRHPKLVLATTILASSLAFIDGSVVNVGLPAISTTFHAGAGDLQWVDQRLSSAVERAAPVGRRSRRSLWPGSSSGGWHAAFRLASVGCAVAPSLPWLLLARGLQGIGAALLMPNSLAILGGAFSGEARGQGYRNLGVDGRCDGRWRSGAGRMADRHGRLAVDISPQYSFGGGRDRSWRSPSFATRQRTRNASRWIFRAAFWRRWPLAL